MQRGGWLFVNVQAEPIHLQPQVNQSLRIFPRALWDGISGKAPPIVVQAVCVRSLQHKPKETKQIRHHL